jgi:glycosyltransferase involved in cell wall biosynthesis
MLQYMACSVPVVASAVGANPGLFAGSNAGALVPPGDSWTEAVLELARKSPAERRTLGAAGREHVDTHFSVASVMDRYAAIFERVVGAHARLSTKVG